MWFVFTIAAILATSFSVYLLFFGPIAAAIICIVLTVGLCVLSAVWFRKQYSLEGMLPRFVREPLPEGAVKTYTFIPVNTGTYCLFPGQLVCGREWTIRQLKEGDRLSIKQYERDGQEYTVVMSDRICSDIGDVPAEQLDEILALMDEYKTIAAAGKKVTVSAGGKKCKSIEVIISCFNA